MFWMEGNFTYNHNDNNDHNQCENNNNSDNHNCNNKKQKHTDGSSCSTRNNPSTVLEFTEIAGPGSHWKLLFKSCFHVSLTLTNAQPSEIALQLQQNWPNYCTMHCPKKTKLTCLLGFDSLCLCTAFCTPLDAWHLALAMRGGSLAAGK